MGKTPPLVYVLLGLTLCGSAVIVYEAFTLPLLRGAALAQGDFELFVVSVALGVPIMAICITILGWVYRKRLSVKSIGSLLGDPIAIVSAFNIAVVLAGLGFSLTIRKVGFFWL